MRAPRCRLGHRRQQRAGTRDGAAPGRSRRGRRPAGPHGIGLADVADAITAEGRHALPLACDLADAASVEQAAQEVDRRLGSPSVLVSAAGTDVPGAVTELSVEDWDRVQSVTCAPSSCSAGSSCRA